MSASASGEHIGDLQRRSTVEVGLRRPKPHHEAAALLAQREVASAGVGRVRHDSCRAALMAAAAAEPDLEGEPRAGGQIAVEARRRRHGSHDSGVEELQRAVVRAPACGVPRVEIERRQKRDQEHHRIGNAEQGRGTEATPHQRPLTPAAGHGIASTSGPPSVRGVACAHTIETTVRRSDSDR